MFCRQKIKLGLFSLQKSFAEYSTASNCDFGLNQLITFSHRVSFRIEHDERSRNKNCRNYRDNNLIIQSEHKNDRGINKREYHCRPQIGLFKYEKEWHKGNQPCNNQVVPAQAVQFCVVKVFCQCQYQGKFCKF
ncbi:hypothetical protein CHS0354_035322 [Potamilus streckersoni]|uniref:Uncharacterized protein n=1 Tax=Potamilus streckersoni TaxID=2493646 RepID=A0AAE0S2M0_9BIVA|nr:hypothetical protein CHS0354_035322 [Potamilus streckersoni]